jgi:phage terminase large subunit-like protein
MTKSKTLEPVLEPFTSEHFHWWIREKELTLEDGVTLWADVIQDFQLELAGDILGAPAGGEVWIIIPEGNAKTTLLAGVALYHADHTHAPWVPIGASSRDQAEIMYAQAAGFVERAPKLKWDRESNPLGMRTYDGYRKIHCYRTGGRGIRVYAADSKTGDGVIPTLALVDELHRHEDLRLYRLWKGKLRKRSGHGERPTIVTISTAGEPGTEFEETRDKIRNEAPERRRNGMHLRAVGRGGRLIFHEWRVQPAGAFADFEAVKGANPLATITAETLEEDFASETTDIGDWKRLKCNIASRSSEAAITDAEWDDAEIGDEIPDGTPVDVGVDVAWKWDTFAIVPFYAPASDERILGEPTILEPPRDGTAMHPDVVKDAFLEMNARWPIRTVVMDTEDAEDIMAWIEDELGCEVIDRGQGNVNAVKDYDAFTKALRNGWLKHTGDVKLRTHVLNAIARRLPGGDRRFDRPSQSRTATRQDRRVIDGLTAAAMVNSACGEDGGSGEIWSFTDDDLNDDEE